ncbi:methyltransferase [Desulfonema ishimotonii]|uniref:Methyltransferase n=1 Tax=Desulfonema ishimotonii TaxID=45657 RepID=A0A401FWQ6_9BACT|nr:corrinoid protein [Desulfonema ishimotonii]GBC61408.1 methyltransferase [Desulfonema ishimotonii]
MSKIFGQLAEAIIDGDMNEVMNLTQKGLDENLTVGDIMSQGLLAGMDVVGQRFKVGDMFIPEVLACAEAMKGAMELLRPLLAEGESQATGKFMIATVKGDLHDIGKNLVAMMFEGAGFDVIDLGIDIAVDDIIEAIKTHKPDVVGFSALLTTTMPKMAETVNALKEAGIRDQVKVLVGGAPVTKKYAEEIGADGYASNAAAAVDKGKELIGIAA